MAQVPLIVLLAGKHNLVGLLSGMAYERLNVYHRWVARGLLLLAAFHFGFFSDSRNKYGVMQLEWAMDSAPPSGMAAYALLLWMNLSTLAPLRNWCYEFFVVQHVLTFFGFIIAVMMHLPGSARYSRVYIYIPVALYLVERLVSTVHCLVNNVRPSRARLEALEGGATRIRVSSRQIKTWGPGTHVQLSIPCFGTHHPATIMSTPQSHNGDLVFILRAYGGFTKRVFRAASHSSSSAEQDKSTYLALISGPNGPSSSHKDFACFDTVFLIAGSTGVTFTLSVLLDLGQRAAAAAGGRLPLRTVQFVWIIQKRSWLSWIADELQSAGSRLAQSGIEFSARIYVTREAVVRLPSEELLTAEKNTVQLDIQPGRPVFDAAFWNALSSAEGESAVGVCGPLSLSTAVRRSVVKMTVRDDMSGISGYICMWRTFLDIEDGREIDSMMIS